KGCRRPMICKRSARSSREPRRGWGRSFFGRWSVIWRRRLVFRTSWWGSSWSGRGGGFMRGGSGVGWWNAAGSTTRRARVAGGVVRDFPAASILVAHGVEGYMAVPLRAAPGNGAGSVLGFLSIHDEGPVADDPRRVSILRIFAARATAELQRMRAEQRVQESE